MNDNKIPAKETIALAIGEIAVSILVCIGFIIAKKFDYTVILGCLIGSTVTVVNFLVLAISINRTLDKILDGKLPEISDEQKTEEPIESHDVQDENPSEVEKDDAAARFAKENNAKLQNAIKLSYITRNIIMTVVLIVALITGWFNVFATVIPLLMFKPILTVYAMMERRKNK